MLLTVEIIQKLSETHMLRRKALVQHVETRTIDVAMLDEHYAIKYLNVNSRLRLTLDKSSKKTFTAYD
jgi:hypothetical protein